jgi:hypothetical protein
MTPAIALRLAAADLAFCRHIDHETMRWIVDESFGGTTPGRLRFARKWRVEESPYYTTALGAASDPGQYERIGLEGLGLVC